MKTRLKELRIEKGYTQRAVALAIQCATSTYAHYEKDERCMDLDTLVRVSRFFDVTTDHILYMDREKC